MKQSKEEIKKNYFFCLKKSGGNCPKNMLGGIACECCTDNDNCEVCGRQSTSFCNRCENGGNKDA